jgi:hypothetical protein
LDNKLTEDKLNLLLPALSLLAEDIGERNAINTELFADIIVSVGVEKDEWAFEELGIWSKILIKARDNFADPSQNAYIVELKDRGIPEFPSILAIYMVKNYQKEPVLIETTNTVKEKKTVTADKPVESYHQRLPDHGWHNDLTWDQLPDWIKKDPVLINKLQRGEPVLGQRVNYKFVSNKLIRRLNDHIPLAYNSKNPKQPSNVYINRYKPVERYNQLLPDHEWHNDLNWEQLPDWIKKDARLISKLRRGEEIYGQTVRYKFVANKVMRRLRNHVSVAHSSMNYKSK